MSVSKREENKMPSIWEKIKAAKAKQKTPEEQAKVKKLTEFAMKQTEGLMGGGMAGTIRNVARRGASAAAASPTFRAGVRAIGQGASEVGRAAARGGRNIARRVAGSAKGKEGIKSKAVQVGSLVALGLGLSRGKNEQKPESQQNTPTPAPNKPAENKASSPQPTSKPAPRSSDSSSNKSASSSEYKTYAKGSAEAKDFRANFAKARKSGDKDFTWQGRKYTTKLKDE